MDSFFNFFSPPDVPGEDDEVDEEQMEELQALIEADYEVGGLRARQGPRATPMRLLTARNMPGLALQVQPPEARPSCSLACALLVKGMCAATPRGTAWPGRSPMLPMRLARPYPQVGATIREKLIPHAVDWYTGEAIEDEPFDFAGYGDEDDEE